MQDPDVEPANHERIIRNPNPSVGVVIGTFAAVPYIHLHLESWRRNYPELPVLVSDDGSPHTAELRDLCTKYGADFASNAERKRRTVGDLSAYVHGLDWARTLDLDLLVKFSRRFVPLDDWVSDFQALAYETQYATFSQCCDHFRFGFRTECIGFHAPTWFASRSLEQLRESVSGNSPCFVEGRIHEMARDVHRRVVQDCRRASEYHHAHPRPHDRDSYAVWTIMSQRRVDRLPAVLWHDSDAPIDYCRAARCFGLHYQLNDFLDPNQGCGLGPE